MELVSQKKLQLVPLIHVDEIWQQVALGVEEACRRSGDDMTGPFLFGECRAGRALLFAIIESGNVNAALVCRVENWNGCRILRILAATGHGMADWLGAITSHRLWPEHLACQKIIFEGRRGWERVLPEARILRLTYEVDFENGRKQNANHTDQQ